jgi:hypothetical protein
MTTVVISQPFLFPWVGLFEQIRQADVFVHYEDVAFSKGSFVNRVQLKSPNGPEWMTVPLRDRHFGQTIRDLTADDRQDWRDRHLVRLEQLYRHAPHLGDMLSLVAGLYTRPWSRFVDLLIESLHEVCRYLGLGQQTRFVRSSNLDVTGSSSQRVRDIVRQLGGDRYVTGHGARHYLDHESLEAAGICVEYVDYQRRPYPQQFGRFDPHVSILDLIANVGRSGMEFIESPSVPWREFLARAERIADPRPMEESHAPRPHFRIPTAGPGQHSPDGGGYPTPGSHAALD